MNRPTRSRSRGFTLIEIVLAIGITLGMFVVVLYFYHQAEHLRQELVLESERIAAARLFLNRIAGELRAARPHVPLHAGLNGSAHSIQFVTTVLPSPNAWTLDALGRAVRPESGLRWITYELAGPGDPSQATGLARVEEPVPELAPLLPDELEAFPELEVMFLEPEKSTRTREFLTSHIRFLHFRYFDGTSWLPSWHSSWVPKGVEITLGFQSISAGAETSPESSSTPSTLSESTAMSEFNSEPAYETGSATDSSYPFPVFRRIVALPGAASNPRSLPEETTNTSLTSPDFP